MSDDIQEEEERLARLTRKLGLASALQRIDGSDYYRKHAEFGEWLRRDRSKVSNDL